MSNADMKTGRERRPIDDMRISCGINPDNQPFVEKRGRVNPTQACRDGDGTCDADGEADGTCTFQLASCFNCIDPMLPECLPVPTHEYGLFLPRLMSRTQVDVDNAAVMLEAVRTLGGTPSQTKPFVIGFDPPLAGGTCTALVPFKVPLRQTSQEPGAKRTTVRSRALGPTPTGLRWDADFLQLTCLPAD